MGKFILKRLLALIPTILIIVFVVYFIMDLTPSSPGQLILGQLASEEAIEAKNIELGYDKPFLIRYVKYIFQLLQGDLGTSWVTGKGVLESVFARFPVTVTLAMILASFPGFWIGMMLIILFAQKLGWLPSYGTGSFAHYILPWFTTACAFIASQLRMTRTSLLESIRMDYVRTARAKGQKESTVIYRHALRNALMPVVTTAGMNFGTLLGGTVTMETVFTLNGVGTLILSSIRSKDVPVVVGAIVILAVCYTLVMLVVDVLYGFIDPQVKARYLKQ